MKHETILKKHLPDWKVFFEMDEVFVVLFPFV